MMREIVDVTQHTPEQAFDLGPRTQVDEAVAEQVERFLADVLGIMQVLQHGA